MTYKLLMLPLVTFSTEVSLCNLTSGFLSKSCCRFWQWADFCRIEWFWKCFFLVPFFTSSNWLHPWVFDSRQVSFYGLVPPEYQKLIKHFLFTILFSCQSHSFVTLYKLSAVSIADKVLISNFWRFDIKLHLRQSSRSTFFTLISNVNQNFLWTLWNPFQEDGVNPLWEQDF